MSANRLWKTYEAYGLKIRSSVALDELPASSAPHADVVIGYGRQPAWTLDFEGRRHAVHVGDGVARFWFEELGGVTVKGGNRITVHLNGGVGREYVKLYVEGMMLAMLLHQRGMCVLHASVVEISGRTVALMGHLGAGKSSIAAGLYARGHRVLADDNAAVLLSGVVPTVMPAYPHVKLFPSIASVLGFKSESLTALHDSQKKMAGNVSDGFRATPEPLRVIYVLGRDHAADITPLSGVQSTVELVRNSIPTRWGHPGDAKQLISCANLARHVPMFAVRTFSDLAALPPLISSLEQHCSRELGRNDVVYRAKKGGANGS